MAEKMISTATPVDWLIFDLGETLVDETANWGRWADHLGIPRLTFFAALGAVIAQRRPHTEVFDLLCPGIDLAAESDRRDAAGSGWGFTAADLYPDAVPTLKVLRDNGYSLGVMANQPLVAAAFMGTLPVDKIAASAEWGVAKPDPRFFERVASEVGAAPRRIAYVGDRVDNDALPAKAAGMLAIHLRRGPWGVIHAEWPEAAEADLRIETLTELPARLAAR
jgi:FMN phosphatase YigB (HAD superfamily)